MIIRLPARVLTGLNGSSDLRCLCGGVPHLTQPSHEMPDALIGVCQCGAWTIFMCTAPQWEAAQAFELAALDLGAESVVIREGLKRRRPRPHLRRARAS
jgi:hypothetical protein